MTLGGKAPPPVLEENYQKYMGTIFFLNLPVPL